MFRVTENQIRKANERELVQLAMNNGKPTNTLKLGRLVREYKRSSANVAKVTIASLVSAAIAALFFTGVVSSVGAESVDAGGPRC